MCGLRQHPTLVSLALVWHPPLNLALHLLKFSRQQLPPCLPRLPVICLRGLDNLLLLPLPRWLPLVDR
jgi:hypothetical protein